jgi:rubrerythrin
MAEITASAVISFVERLEEDSACLYEQLARRFEDQRDRFLTFARDSEKNRVLVVRTYRETITDALEACFSFEGLDLAGYAVETTLAEDASLAEALAATIALERKACAFYADVAQRSQSLLATIPGAFKRVAKRRGRRGLELEAMLEAANG